MTAQISTEQATAASSGASATERFHADKSPFAAVHDTAPERVDRLARRVLDAVYQTIRDEKVTYDEYNALKAWLINVGEDGEWPLFLDVWVERIRGWLGDGKDVYVYFDNDMKGYAPHDALALQERL